MVITEEKAVTIDEPVHVQGILMRSELDGLMKLTGKNMKESITEAVRFYIRKAPAKVDRKGK